MYSGETYLTWTVTVTEQGTKMSSALYEFYQKTVVFKRLNKALLLLNKAAVDKRGVLFRPYLDS